MMEDKCRELVEQARQASKSKNWAEALQKYQAALARYESSWLYFNIGRMQHRLGQHGAAIGSYDRYLSSPQQPGDELDRVKAREYLAQAKKELTAPSNSDKSTSQSSNVEVPAKSEVVGTIPSGQRPDPGPQASPGAGSVSPAPSIPPTKPSSRVPTKWIVVGCLAGLAVVGGVVGGVVYGVRAQVPDDTRDLRWSQVSSALLWR